jgi:putative transposase
MGRFKSILIEREGYLLQVIRYIHLNPVRAGLAGGLDELERNVRSGHSHIVGGEGPGWLKVSEVRAAFGDSCHGTPWNYMDFMKAGLGIGADRALSDGNYVIGRSGIEPISKYSLD